MFVVGVTGGIGSGKSTVTNLFSELGVKVIDADVIARDLVSPGSKSLTAITKRFGQHLVLEDGNLDRRKLRDIIFSDPNAKKWLENLLHPEVKKQILEEIENSKSSYTIVSAPLLLEAGLDQITDRVLVVDIPEASQIERTVLRDRTSEESVNNIIQSQIKRKIRLQKATDIIDNTGSLDDTKKQVKKLHTIYLNLASKKQEP